MDGRGKGCEPHAGGVGDLIDDEGRVEAASTLPMHVSPGHARSGMRGGCLAVCVCMYICL